MIRQRLSFVVPDKFWNPVQFQRFGAMIKDRVTGRIVGHVQEGMGFPLDWLSLPGGNPLGLAMKAVEHVQLHRIQQTLNTVQTLATVGAVASVASLGVSIAGFAAVLHRLDRMEGKLDTLLHGNRELRNLAERLHLKFDFMALAQLRGTLNEMSLAFLSTDHARRRDTIRGSVTKLAELRLYYGSLLADREFCARGTEDLVGLLDAEERMVAASQGELVGEFFLNDELAVMRERRRLQREMFDHIAWKNERDLHEMVLTGDRRARVDLTIAPEWRVERVKAIGAIRSESSARLDSMLEMATLLRGKGIDFDSYRAQISERTQATGDLLLFIDAGDERDGTGQPE